MALRKHIPIFLIMAIMGCGGPPQLGTDEETFKTVDALFTAVTARQPKLVNDCDVTLARLHDSGKLPDAAWKNLRGVMDQANAGQWESASRQLYDFMRGQRREGGYESPRLKKKGQKQ